MEIDIEKLEVRRWAFCPRCKGVGCSECQGRGTVVELVLLNEIPDIQRRVYIAAQKDFIQEWQKLSAATKKRWQDPDYRDKQIATHTGKHPTDETRAKLSAAAKKRWQDPDYRDKQTATRIGKHPTAEHRAKISAALTRRHNEAV